MASSGSFSGGERRKDRLPQQHSNIIKKLEAENSKLAEEKLRVEKLIRDKSENRQYLYYPKAQIGSSEPKIESPVTFRRFSNPFKTCFGSPRSCGFLMSSEALPFEVETRYHGSSRREVVLMMRNNEQIVKRLIGALDISTLLKCRLVNKTWNAAASFVLRKKVALHFFKATLFFVTRNMERLEDFTDFMISSSIKGFQGTFPCTRYIFHGDGLKNRSLQAFLSMQGFFIKELAILNCPNLQIQTNSKKIAQEREDQLLTQVKYLLVHQAPNLHLLELDIRPKVKWDSDSETTTREDRSSLKITDKEFTEIRPIELISGLEQNENLKKFYFGGSTSSKLFELVLKLSPKLEEVSMIENNYAWLLDPFYRGQLLKHLQLYGNERPFVRTYALARSVPYIMVCKPHTMYRYTNFDKYFQLQDWKSECDLNTKGMINRILELCSSSIETITWEPVELMKELEWPQVMTNVIKLKCNSLSKEGIESRQLFPSGFRIKKIFPQLKTVYFHIFDGSDNFDNLMESWNCKPILSVRNVFLSFINFPRKQVSKVDLKQVMNLFPKARVDVVEFIELKEKEPLYKAHRHRWN